MVDVPQVGVVVCSLARRPARLAFPPRPPSVSTRTTGGRSGRRSTRAPGAVSRTRRSALCHVAERAGARRHQPVRRRAPARSGREEPDGRQGRERGTTRRFFRLSGTARWLLGVASGPSLQHLKAMLAFVEQLDFSSVTAEVISSIFERLISRERRRDMGQHYTQPRVARSISRWAADDETLTYAGVSSGAGTFPGRGLRGAHGQGPRARRGARAGAWQRPRRVRDAPRRRQPRYSRYTGARTTLPCASGTRSTSVAATTSSTSPRTTGRRSWSGGPPPAWTGSSATPPYDEKPLDVDKARSSLHAIGGQAAVPVGDDRRQPRRLVRAPVGGAASPRRTTRPRAAGWPSPERQPRAVPRLAAPGMGRRHLAHLGRRLVLRRPRRHVRAPVQS